MLRNLFSWIFVGVALVGAFWLFNYQQSYKGISLSQIFPEKEETLPMDVEYEYIDTTASQETKPTSDLEVAKIQQPVAALQPAKVTQEKVAEVVTPAPAPEIITSAARTKAVSESPFNTASFTIQVASLKDKQKAETFLSGVQSKGYTAYVVPSDLGDKGVWYRVYIGRFDQRSKAEELLTQVRQDYKDSFILSPKKSSN